MRRVGGVIAVAVLLLGLQCGLGVGGLGSSQGGPPIDAGVDVPGESTVVDSPNEVLEASSDVRDECGANLENDPGNCGSCGHDCLGGTCSSGQCQPVTLISGEVPLFLLETPGKLFWTGSTGVRACVLPGCQGSVQTFASGSSLGLAATASNLYWTDSIAGSVSACDFSLPTCAIPTSIATATPGASFLVIGATSIFWTERTGNRIMRADLGGGNAGAVASGGPIQSPTGIAIQASNLYFSNYDNASAGQGVMTLSTSGGNPASFASGSTVEQVLTTASGVFFSINGSKTTNDGAIGRCDLDGSNCAAFAPARPFPRGITSDGTSLYWTDFGVAGDAAASNGAVLRCPLTGCGANPTVLASGQGGPLGIVVDSQAIYWANAGTGSIQRLAK
jgi:hypothetical protein